jgi:hypothetical protein
VHTYHRQYDHTVASEARGVWKERMPD